jgi:hypothetical protein
MTFLNMQQRGWVDEIVLAERTSFVIARGTANFAVPQQLFAQADVNES